NKINVSDKRQLYDPIADAPIVSDFFTLIIIFHLFNT
ncbi:MAG: hypothetical protein ACJAXH_001766, partial [Colwellia sp.]